jgi:hypothetical protein
MGKIMRRCTRLLSKQGLLHASTWTTQPVLFVAACTLWVGLAVPGVQLIPGVGGGKSQSVAIALQSALLGIIDTSGRQSDAAAAARAFGLGAPLSANLLHAPAGDVSLVAHLDPSVREALGAVTRKRAPAAGVPVVSQTLVSAPAKSAPATSPVDVALPGPPAGAQAPASPSVPAPPQHRPGVPAAAPPAPAVGPVVTPRPPELLGQSIAFTSIPPPGASVGDVDYMVAALASSGLPVALSIADGSKYVCSLAGGAVTFVAGGTCVVEAEQPGNQAYRAATSVQQSFSVSDAALASAQSVVFTTVPPAGSVVGGPPYVAAASASSGLTVAFSVTSGSIGVCTVTGSTVDLVGAGTCTVEASQFGDGRYYALGRARQSFYIAPRPQAIVFSSGPPAGATVGGAPVVLTATATSGLPVVFSANSASAAVCAVSAATVTLLGQGVCTVDANQFGDSAYGQAPTAQQSFTVAPGAPTPSIQSVDFLSTPPNGATSGGTYAVLASSSSGLPVALSVDVWSTNVCTLSGSTVLLIGIGTCTVIADQAGNTSYESAPSAQQSFAVVRASQSIAFVTAPPAGALVGDPAYVAAATASSGLAVSLSAAPTSAGVCVVAGSTVSLIGGGTCTIDAGQAGDAAYQAAVQVQQSFRVTTPSRSVQSVSFTSSPPAAIVGGAMYTIAAAASSGLAVAFSVDAGSTGVCGLGGGTVTFLAVGTCTIDADQAGDASYLPAAHAQQSFAVMLAAQTIAFSSAPPSIALVGDPDYAISAVATSGLPVTFSLDASSAGICSISGASISFAAAGVCTVNADQAGNGSYDPAVEAQQSFTVGGGAPSPSVQSIGFTSSPPPSAVVGAAYVVSASASSGLAVLFSIDASSAAVCSVSGVTVTATGPGTCTVDADQGGDAGYQAAPRAQQSFSVTLAPQTIAFMSSPPANALVGGTSYSVAATASSGLPVTIAVAPASSGVCVLSGALISFVGPGTCALDADQGGNGTYQAAPQTHQSFAVGNPPTKSVQSIQFTSNAPAAATVGGSGYSVSATASSGLTVSFSIAASSAAVCTISGPAVSFTGPGTCTVAADQPGNGSYLPATQATQSLAVSLAGQSVHFTSPPPVGATVGGASYAVAASAGSGLAVTFGVDPSSAGVCAVSGSTVTFVGGGTCTVDANQAGNGAFQAAPEVQQSFSVARASQSITITSTPPPVDRADPPYTVAVSASSGLGVVLTVDPSSAGVCAASGFTVSFSGRGTCIVYADQPGDGSYLPAPQDQQVFRVKNHTPE